MKKRLWRRGFKGALWPISYTVEVVVEMGGHFKPPDMYSEPQHLPSPLLSKGKTDGWSTMPADTIGPLSARQSLARWIGQRISPGDKTLNSSDWMERTPHSSGFISEDSWDFLTAQTCQCCLRRAALEAAQEEKEVEPRRATKRKGASGTCMKPPNPAIRPAGVIWGYLRLTVLRA